MKWACLALLASGLAQPQNWPQFRGAGAAGVADQLNTPLSWDAETGANIVWKTAIPGLGHASPVIWGGRVFVVTAVSSDPNSVFRPGLYGAGEPAADVSRHSFRIYALDLRTGKLLWERVAHEGAPRVKRHPKSSFASATPATDGKHLLVSFGSEGLYCYTVDGKLLWKADLGVIDAGAFDVPEFQWGTASSPVIWRDLAVVQCDQQKGSYIAAYRLKDGSLAWKTARQALPSWSSPTVVELDGRAELVTNGAEHIRGYDPLTGRELWRLRGTSMISNPTPFAAGGLIYVASGYRRFIQPIYAIRPGASGDITRSHTFLAWSKETGAPYIPTPIVYGDYFYACSTQGILTCSRAGTGEQVYQQRIGKGGAFSASPVASDGRLYFASEEGDVYVVKAGPDYEELAVNRMGEVCMATPALAPGMLVARGQRHVFGIGEKR